ncbi:MAG: zinc protease [Gammaproteobacteria bacterium]|jgi:zinc protease
MRFISFSSIFCTLVLFAQAASAIPDIQHWVTDNGARVYFVPAPEIPMVDVRFVFSAGSARDEGKAGLAHLVGQLISEGAGELDANVFSEQLAQTGAMLSTGAMRDMAWVSLRTLSDDEYSRPALALMQLALSKPRFDTAAFERERANQLIRIKREQQSPASIASNTFFKQLYGSHPYGSPVSGTEASVVAITIEDVRSFHHRYYAAKNTTVSIVGALTRAQAEELASKLSTNLDAGEKAPAIKPVTTLAEPIEQRIDFPSIQSHVKLGQPGLKRGDEDYFALLVGNHVLGGSGLVSILFDEVREKRGLSYSVGSDFSPMAELGPFSASLQTDNSQSDEAISVLRDEIGKFIATGPSAEALTAAKQNLIGGFPLRISSNSKTLEYVSMIGFYELPLDYLKTFGSFVDAVTIEDVRSAFSRRLDLDKMVLVVVGKSKVDES